VDALATALIAWFVFHEHIDRRVILGMACLISGAIVLSWSGQPTLTSVLGPLAIVGACIAWGLDNNLTRKVSLSDPLQIVELNVVPDALGQAVASTEGEGARLQPICSASELTCLRPGSDRGENSRASARRWRGCLKACPRARR
jgi:hypothetical protein